MAGLLAVDGDADAGERRFLLPSSHAAVLAEPESVLYAAPFGPMLAGIGAALPAVVESYRDDGGVPYAAYGNDFRQGQGAINRPGFVSDVPPWLAAMPDVDARLRAHPPARVADLGCGQGWSTVAIAGAYPCADVIGLDLDQASVDEARALTASKPGAERLTFLVGDAVELGGSAPFDLICIFESLHYMARPVDVLSAARAALSPGGSVFVVDERVNDDFTAPGEPVERMMCGWSVLHCLPASRVDQQSAALGTVLRTPMVVELATRAGLGTVEVLPIGHDWFRFYRLTD